MKRKSLLLVAAAGAALTAANLGGCHAREEKTITVSTLEGKKEIKTVKDTRSGEKKTTVRHERDDD